MKGLLTSVAVAASLMAIDVPAKAVHESPLPRNAERLSHGRFKDIIAYRPDGAPKSFVLFLSGEHGWNARAAEMARVLVDQDAMVVGIDTPGLLQDFDHDGGDCSFPDGDLENLSHWVQAYYHLPTYRAPILVGYSSGAALAFGVLAQSPKDTFSGALSLAFRPQLRTRTPLCKGSGFESRKRADRHGFDFLPPDKLGNPWTVLQGQIDEEYPAKATQDFVSKVPGAELVMLPKVGHGFGVEADWKPQFLAAFSRLAAIDARLSLPPPPTALGDLPVVEVPATGTASDNNTFAIILSGDGGWAGLDQDVAKALSARGIPVVGLDSLRYYWTPRKPEGVAADVDKLVRYYLAHWNRQRVLLIGYSQGADVMPFILNRLPEATRSKLAIGAAMGLGTHAAFEFHVTNWVQDDDSGLPILPEARKITGVPFLCIYGTDETDSLCPQLDPHKVKVVAMKGGHHFGGNYDALAGTILDAAKPLETK